MNRQQLWKLILSFAMKLTAFASEFVSRNNNRSQFKLIAMFTQEMSMSDTWIRGNLRRNKKRNIFKALSPRVPSISSILFTTSFIMLLLLGFYLACVILFLFSRKIPTNLIRISFQLILSKSEGNVQKSYRWEYLQEF